MGTTLADLVKGFRANVREGNPCELRFDGKAIQLFPLPAEPGDKEGEGRWDKTRIGILMHPNTK